MPLVFPVDPLKAMAQIQAYLEELRKYTELWGLPVDKEAHFNAWAAGKKISRLEEHPKRSRPHDYRRTIARN